MENLQQILAFLHKIEKLKTIQRKVSISDNSRKESPAEHTWRVAIMAMVLHRELKLEINLIKSLEIILVHDIIEAIAGDVWITDKNDTKSKDEQKEKEFLAAKEIYDLLPNNLSIELKDLWLEYESQSSGEAKFAKALDKIEVIIQRMDLGEENWERNDIYDILHDWANDSIVSFPQLDNMWALVQEELQEMHKNFMINHAK